MNFMPWAKKARDPYSSEKSVERWSDIAQQVKFLPTDAVLDMGSAEGLVSLEVAPLVAHVHGVELKSQWVRRAKNEAKRRGIKNATFEQGSALTYEPRHYDVVLFLDVMGKSDDNGRKVGLSELAKLCEQQNDRWSCVVASDPAVFSGKKLRRFSMQPAFDGYCLPKVQGRGDLAICTRRQP